MAVFLLSDELVFPDPRLADEDGLLAVGGDVGPDRLLLAYTHGIFPWSSEGEPILWWCPAPRMVLFLDELKVARSLRKAIRRRPFRLTIDRAFTRVLEGCAETPRPGQDGTWLHPALKAGMSALHRRGIAHSVEAWDGDELVGGLYGLALGSVFCGESMFARRTDASKIAFVALVEQLGAWGFTMIDCQQPTEHLRRFGAREIALEDFLGRLGEGLRRPWKIGPWSFDPADAAGRADAIGPGVRSE
ncbi:MAG: leucyl/phenylalanyl-tRNA--protein transferase [Myxococcales bacterium]|nr:leucyl/phenylalanyl-tRNA--protein transferase [Myxococcales bacterium]MCB9704993.1 leucyl/phenylalanyl-tRNA--protein transferase [Myxococcales bacterium]